MSNTFGVPVDSMDVAFSTPTTSPSRPNIPPPTAGQDGSAMPLPPPISSSSSVHVNLLPSSLWSLPYLTHSTEILNAAVLANAVRVGELFAGSTPHHTISPSTPQPSPLPVPSQPSFRIAAPRIAEYDGSQTNLRSFCSLLVNQIQGFQDQFPDEMAKVRYAYQCLGPKALIKMRSSFRCLEDPTVPPEITTLGEFLEALKQRCQDPGQEEKANRALEGLYQLNTPFHDFISIFEDYMADSMYAHYDKSEWLQMLRRKLSPKLQDALVMPSDIPTEYHAFVAYIRKKDSAFHQIRVNNSLRKPSPTALPRSTPHPNFPLNFSTPHPTPSSGSRELTVSQGGSAIDLDSVSRQKGLDGRLTPQAKDARRALGRCVWCNRQGHATSNCPLGLTTIASASTQIQPNSEENLKELLQQ